MSAGGLRGMPRLAISSLSMTSSSATVSKATLVCATSGEVGQQHEAQAAELSTPTPYAKTRMTWRSPEDRWPPSARIQSSLYPVIRDVSPRSNSPRMSACSSECAALGLSVSLVFDIGAKTTAERVQLEETGVRPKINNCPTSSEVLLHSPP